MIKTFFKAFTICAFSLPFSSFAENWAQAELAKALSEDAGRLAKHSRRAGENKSPNRCAFAANRRRGFPNFRGGEDGKGDGVSGREIEVLRRHGGRRMRRCQEFPESVNSAEGVVPPRFRGGSRSRDFQGVRRNILAAEAREGVGKTRKVRRANRGRIFPHRRLSLFSGRRYGGYAVGGRRFVYGGVRAGKSAILRLCAQIPFPPTFRAARCSTKH